MGNKINIAELLKDCPQGMELDCTMYDNCTYEGIEDVGYIDILINTPSGRIRLTKEGCYIRHDDNAKCVIFPKGKTTWKGFHRPFVEGDIVSTESGMYIGIVKSTEDSHRCDTFCSINDEGDFFIDNNFLFSRFATEEEKQKLFDAIKAKGYKWNAETKTLVKLPKFKNGDIIFSQYYDLKYVAIVKKIDESNDIYVYCLYGFTDAVFAVDEILGKLEESHEIRLATEKEKQVLFDAIMTNGYHWNEKVKTLEKLIEPIFKKGDKVRVKKGFPDRIARIIEDVCDTFYTLVSVGKIDFTDQDNWELVPDKFDISKLKPFDEVLVRDFDSEVWEIDFFSKILDGKHFKCHGASYVQCIPYKGNEHLHNSTNACNDYFKTWEK